MTPSRTILYATLGAIVLVVAAWMFLIFRPKGDEIADLQEQVAQAESQESSLRAQVARLQELDEERPSVEAELRQLTAAVPPQPELATLILTLHDQATRSGIDFLQFTPTPPAAGPTAATTGASVINAGIDVEGSFFTTLEFLDRIEGLDRIVVVDSLELNAREPDVEEAEEEQEDTGASTTSLAEGSGSDTVDTSEVVQISTEFGDVTTDAASLNAAEDGDGATSGDTRSGSDAGAALATPEPFSFPPGSFTVRMTLQVRTFTTAQPAIGEGAEGETTTTTAPADGTTPTTVAPEEGG